VVLIRNQRQWGRYTGIVSELPPFALIYTFRDGKTVRCRIFPSHDKALEAVGWPSRPTGLVGAIGVSDTRIMIGISHHEFGFLEPKLAG
jgi:hypothetical protein